MKLATSSVLWGAFTGIEPGLGFYKDIGSPEGSSF